MTTPSKSFHTRPQSEMNNASATRRRFSCLLALLLLTTRAEAGVTFTTLWSFNGTNGAVPEATLVQGRDGALYGTTIGGGTNDLANGGRGTVFRISTNGQFSTLVHLDYPTGSNPQSGLVQGSDGDFYGVTDYGGDWGVGVAYRMSPTGSYVPLCSFGWTNGVYPHGLTEGTDGWFYGTTIYGGLSADSLGTVFKVSTNGDLLTLASFQRTNGAHPQAPLLRAADGNFYGTTVNGGTNGGWGTFFRMTPGGELTSLVSFNGTNGTNPMSALVQDAAGNIYGTTSAGGRGFANSAYSGDGTVFKFTPQGELKTLHFFRGYPDDGSRPHFGGLSLGPDGEFYGTTQSGGANGSGTVFALNTNGESRLLYSFSQRAGSMATNFDGAEPSAGLVLASDGNFYGVTMSGGESGKGTIFRLGFGSDAPVISIKRQAGGTLELSWSAVLGHDYQVQSNPGLNPTNWLNEGRPIRAAGSVVTISIAIGPGQARFYRVILLAEPAPAAAEDFTFTTNNGAITITGYVGAGGTVAIPDSINGLPVTGIGDNAFSGQYSLVDVRIPASVVTIGREAFASCSMLTKVVIPNGVASIGGSAFQGCAILSGVKIPASVSSIGPDAFAFCYHLFEFSVDPLNVSYRSVDGVLFDFSQATLVMYPGGRLGAYAIPNTVTRIGESAFSGCGGLWGVSIPGSVISIEKSAFWFCRMLTEVIMPNSITNIGDHAFWFCDSMAAVTLGDAVSRIGNSAFGYCSSLRNITIPGSVINLEPSVFMLCNSLTNATLRSGVRSIGDLSFAHCANLTGLVIPDSVTSIGSWSFSQCTRLTSVAISDTVTNLGESAFAGCTGLTNVTVGGHFLSVGNSAFGSCTNLSQLTIREGVVNIGESAFAGCFNLASVTIADSVTNLGSDAFAGCYGLVQMPLSSGVVSIGDFAFWECTNLSSVWIPSGVTNIGKYVFGGCLSMTGIGVDPASAFYSSRDGVLFNRSQSLLIEYPCAKAGSYVVPSGVAGIGKMAFFGCVNLTDVSIPASVTMIEVRAFGACPKLTAITVADLNPAYRSFGGVVYDASRTTLVAFPSGRDGSFSIPAGVTNIGESAFSVCDQLSGVTIPDGVVSIGPFAFPSCDGLTDITLPDSVTMLGDGAFVDCQGLKNASLGQSLISLGNLAFASCFSLTNIILPSSLTSIGDQAFASCKSLTSVRIPDSVTILGYATFVVCNNLSKVTVGNGVTRILQNTFGGCVALTNAIIGNQVTNIDGGAFWDCGNLAGIYFKGNAPATDGYTFARALNATVYYLPGTTGWGPAFGGRPTALWQPQVQTGEGSFGVRTNRFGFNIAWASGMIVVVETCTNLTNPLWSPLQTNTLAGDSFYFSDPAWTNYSRRFYRVRWP